MIEPVKGKKTLIKIVSGPGKGQKFFLKDTLSVGGRRCDVKIGGAEEKGELFSIEKVSGVSLLRARVTGCLRVNGVETREKILENGDCIESGKAKLRFCEVSEDGGGSLLFNRRLFLLFTAFLAFFMAVMVLSYINEQYCPITTQPVSVSDTRSHDVVTRDFSEEEVTDLIAEARRRFTTAMVFYNQAEVDNRNFAFAIMEWERIVLSLSGIDPKPEIFFKAKEMLSKSGIELKERVRYLRNNAYAAHKSGKVDDLEDILVKIMTIISDPTDADYIWAKKKLFDLYNSSGK